MAFHLAVTLKSATHKYVSVFAPHTHTHRTGQKVMMLKHGDYGTKCPPIYIGRNNRKMSTREVERLEGVSSCSSGFYYIQFAIFFVLMWIQWY